MSPISCPRCGAVDQFTRAQLLYEASVSSLKGHVSGSSVSAGLGAGLPAAIGGGLGVGVMSGSIQATQATQLAQRVAPPPRPWVPSGVGVLAVLLPLGAGLCMFLVLMIGAVLAHLRATDPFAGPFWRVLAAAAIFVSALLVGFSRPAFARERKRGPYREALERRWQAEFEAWRKLWFCARCGHSEHLHDDDGAQWIPRPLPVAVLEPTPTGRHFVGGFLVTAVVCGLVVAAADLGFQGMAVVAGVARSNQEAQETRRVEQQRESEAIDTKSCDAGDGPACARVAQRAGDGAPDQQLKYLKLACTAKHGPACEQLGEMYITGSRYVAARTEDAIRFYGQACDLQQAKACLKAARNSYRDQPARYVQACQLGLAEGCEAAAAQYFVGINCSKDVPRALELLERACTGGNAPACAELRDRYRAGRDVPADPAKAKAYDDRTQTAIEQHFR